MSNDLVRTNLATVQAVVAALNAHDLVTLKTFWAADGQERFPDAVCFGPDEIARYFQGVIDALPDLRIEPRAFAAEGDSVFMRHVISGTHTGGPFKGIATTGRRVEVPGIDHFTLREGKIVSNFVVFDQMEMGRQLGLLPSDESTADKALKVAFNGVTELRRRVAAARNR
jgi:predicted ester cyclase